LANELDIDITVSHFPQAPASGTRSSSQNWPAAPLISDRVVVT
jgi:hypothetical protein